MHLTLTGGIAYFRDSAEMKVCMPFETLFGLIVMYS